MRRRRKRRRARLVARPARARLLLATCFALAIVQAASASLIKRTTVIDQAKPVEEPQAKLHDKHTDPGKRSRCARECKRAHFRLRHRPPQVISAHDCWVWTWIELSGPIEEVSADGPARLWPSQITRRAPLCKLQLDWPRSAKSLFALAKALLPLGAMLFLPACLCMCMCLFVCFFPVRLSGALQFQQSTQLKKPANV